MFLRFQRIFHLYKFTSALINFIKNEDQYNDHDMMLHLKEDDKWEFPHYKRQ